MYDPSLGRWISEDPTGFDAGDVNLYRSVGNNPVNDLDPAGLEDKKPKVEHKHRTFGEYLLWLGEQPADVINDNREKLRNAFGIDILKDVENLPQRDLDGKTLWSYIVSTIDNTHTKYSMYLTHST